jgi:hypothetical protein
MNFYLAQYDLAFNAEIQNSDPGALFFCSYDPRVELKRKDSAKERVAKKKIKDLYVFFSATLFHTHTAATQTPSLL